MSANPLRHIRATTVCLAAAALASLGAAASAPDEVALLQAWSEGLVVDPRSLAEIARFRYKDDVLGEAYAIDFASGLREQLFRDAVARLEELRDGRSTPFIEIEFPDPGFLADGAEPARKVERKFEEGFTFSELVAHCRADSATPAQALDYYTSSDLRMATSSRIKRIWVEDGLDCVETSGVTAVLSPTLTCSCVDVLHEAGISAEHSQLVANPGGEDYKDVYFKESLKICVATDDGIWLYYANYTWTDKLGSIKRHFGRGKIKESRERAIQELQARLDGSQVAE